MSIDHRKTTSQVPRTIASAILDATHEALTIAETVRDQDIETLPENVIQLRRGVAKDRRISVEDDEMRHGRKSRSHRFDGYKRHVLRDLDSGLVRATIRGDPRGPCD